MRPDSSPDNVPLAFDNFVPILESRSTVGRPSHFEDAGRSFYSFDPEPRSKLPLS